MLSKVSSIDAIALGLREFEPLFEPVKMTSAMDSPRNLSAELSPITQRTASMMLDFPQPFGPTTAHRFPGKFTEVGSTNDLKPVSLIPSRRMSECSYSLSQR